MSLDDSLRAAGVYDLLANVRNIDDIKIYDIYEISNIIDALQPHFKIRLVGKGYEQTVSYGVSTTLVELQKIIYKTYSIATYGTSNTNNLTHLDKEQLEIFFRVGAGSSEIVAKLSETIHSIAGRAVEKMTSKQVFIIVLISILSFSGYHAYKQHIDIQKQLIDDKEKERQAKLQAGQQEIIYKMIESNERSQEKLLKSNEKTQEDLLNILKRLATEDTRTEEIYLLNVEKVPELILKTTASTEFTEFNGYSVSGETAKLLNKKPSDSYKKFTEDWDVIILGVNRTLDEEGNEDLNDWKLTIHSPYYGKNFTISLSAPSLLSKTKIKMLWASIEKSSVITVSISGKKSNDELIFKELSLRDIKE